MLAGGFYGAVLAAIAGASRTDGVGARAGRNNLSPDEFIVPQFSRHGGDRLQFDHIANFPEVARAIHIRWFMSRELDVYGYADESVLAESSRLLEGRLPRTGSSD